MLFVLKWIPGSMLSELKWILWKVAPALHTLGDVSFFKYHRTSSRTSGLNLTLLVHILLHFSFHDNLKYGHDIDQFQYVCKINRKKDLLSTMDI